MGKKNQYFKQSVPHLKEKYGAEKADAITASAWRHYEAICAENPDEWVYADNDFLFTSVHFPMQTKTMIDNQ